MPGAQLLMLRKGQKRNPDSTIDAGRVSTQAMARLRTVAHCSPEWLAAIVPATPAESTCAALTGKPNQSAARAVISAASGAAAVLRSSPQAAAFAEPHIVEN